MVRKLIITNHKNEQLELDIFQPEKSGLTVRKLTGVGPVQASITTTDIASGDGKIFNFARKSERAIDLQLGLMELVYKIKDGYDGSTEKWHWETIEECRHRVYQYFPLKQKIKFEVITDTRHVYTYGYVEQNDPDIWSDDETQDVQILCTNPYFIDIEQQSFEMSLIDPRFEFPRDENERDALLQQDQYIALGLKHSNYDGGLNDANHPFIFGEYTFDNEFVLDYKGECETGCIFKVSFTGKVEDFQLMDITKNEILYIKPANISSIACFNNGDVLTICTKTGEKKCELLSNSQITNCIGMIDRGSTWLTFSQGENVFGYSSVSGIQYINIEVIIDPLYEGI